MQGQRGGKDSPALLTRRWSAKAMWMPSGWLRGSIYWVLLFRDRFAVTKPLSQIQRSTLWPLQDADPTPSFGGFGFKESLTMLIGHQSCFRFPFALCVATLFAVMLAGCSFERSYSADWSYSSREARETKEARTVPSPTPTSDCMATETPAPTDMPMPVSTATGTGTSNSTKTVPDAPANAYHVRVCSTRVVSWDPSAGATHYMVYYDDNGPHACREVSSARSAFCELLAGNVTGTTYTHANPDEDSNYYWVVACNSAGCSDIGQSENPAIFLLPGGPEGTPTPVPTAIPAPPGYVFVLVVGRSSSSVTLRLFGDGETHFELRRRAATAPAEWIDLGRHDTFRFDDLGLDSNATYYYSAKACNSIGCSEYSDETGVITEAAGRVDVPATPTGVRGIRIDVSLESDDARITWNEVPGATYYEVFEESDRDATIGAPRTSYQDFDPNRIIPIIGFQGSEYKVRACNKAGCSAFSEWVTVS